MDRLSPERRSANMRRIRSNSSIPEMQVRQLVYGMGYRYRLHVRDLPGKPDLVFRGLGKIIEVRGCFWHQHPGCIDSHIPKSRRAYWGPKLKGNCKRDATNTDQLKAMGWKLLIVWECQLTNPARVARRIARFLATAA